LYFYLKRQNTIRDALTPEERQQWIDEGKTGDAHPDFRYVVFRRVKLYFFWNSLPATSPW
jgi:hypothetical protein